MNYLAYDYVNYAGILNLIHNGIYLENTILLPVKLKLDYITRHPIYPHETIPNTFELEDFLESEDFFEPNASHAIQIEKHNNHNQVLKRNASK